MLKKLICWFTWHTWTSAVQQGIEPTEKQLADGIQGFWDYAKMYCSRCGHVYKSKLHP